MALGTLARQPGLWVEDRAGGTNYFHAHKFRSRAVIEFGNPIESRRSWWNSLSKANGGNRGCPAGHYLPKSGCCTVTSPDYLEDITDA